MNKRQKELQQQYLNNEKDVLKKLERNYQDALDEINSKIELLMARQDADMQHVIYQVEYQKALKTQVQAILETLQTNEFETVSEYLAKSYEDGFVGTMYDLQGQGIPLIFPIDQEQVVEAIQQETKLSENLYTAMGHDIKDLQKKISGEISRGLASGQMYSEITRNIASWARIPKNNAVRIARTEAHRIQTKASMNACNKAKSKGADVVKQWDASLDKRTRDSHAQVDGEIRELNEKFSNGLMYPGDPSGAAAEVINCRCALLQRARWALGNDYTKWSEDAPVVIDDDGTTQFVNVDAKSYKEFKGYYKDITGQMTMNFENGNPSRVRSSVQKIKQGTSNNISMAADANSIKWEPKGKKISNESYKSIMSYARSKDIELSGFKQYDGKIETIMQLVDDADSVLKLYPELKKGKNKVVFELDELMDSEDFAKTVGHIIHINANAFRNADMLNEEYMKAVKDKWFAQGTDYHAIVKHEIGHVVANKYNINGLEIAEKITGKKGAYLSEFLEKNLSRYSASYEDGREIISECFASVYGGNTKNEFALKFVEECGKIIPQK